MVAPEWLKVNNPLYEDVTINTNWEEDAAQDDSELWEAVSSQLSSQAPEAVPVDASTSVTLLDDGLADQLKKEGIPSRMFLAMATASSQQCNVSYRRLMWN